MKADDAYILAKKYTDKTIEGAGGLKGEDGFSPIIVENSDNTDTVYKLDITDVNGTITTPNLKADESHIPTKTSELTNDSGFITESQLKAEETARTNADTELQTQIDGKANVNHKHLSADIIDKDATPTNGSDNVVTSGGVYAAVSSKQDTITGGASTITSNNLTTNRALVSDANGKIAVSAVTSMELGYLDGVTSNVQTQIENETNARKKADAPIRKFMESTANYTDVVNLTEIRSETEIRTDSYNVGDILYIQNTDTGDIDWLRSNIDPNWNFSETIVSGQTYKVKITKKPVSGADMENGVITVLDNITLKYELNNVQPKLNNNATNFLGLIEQIGSSDFYFDGSLDFGYIPTVNNIDVAIRPWCSGTAYDTGKIWIDGSPIYRVDFKMLITNTTVLKNGRIDLNAPDDELLFPYEAVVVNYSVSSVDVKVDTGCILNGNRGIYEIKFEQDDNNNVILYGFIEYLKNDTSSPTHTVS